MADETATQASKVDAERDKTAAAVRKQVDAGEQPLVHGSEQVQDAFDVANAQGFFGERFNPIPLERYSLETGPDAPTVVEERAAMAKAEVA